MEFDYIVVGAGSAGCVLAARLSEDPGVNVLLVEAGQQDRHPLVHMPAGFADLIGEKTTWGWSTAPQEHLDDTVYWYPQGKILGGGSSINAQVYTRGNRRDYDGWKQRHGCVEWGYEDVLPYFRKAEDNEVLFDEFHGMDGPLGVSDPINPLPISKAFIRAAQQAGIRYNRDFNGLHQQGMGLYQTTTRNARRSSTASSYLKQARGRSNLEVRTSFLTRRILIENKKAVGIEIAGRSGRPEQIRCRREVILSAGAIGSPRMLMLSGIGDGDDLQKLDIPVKCHLPGVGRNFHDHFDLYIVCECNGDLTYDKHNRLYKKLVAGLQYVFFKTGPVTSNLCEAGGFWTVSGQEDYPEIQFHLMLGSGINSGADKLRNCGLTLNTAVMRPKARGSVRLISNQVEDAPIIDPNFWGHPDDIDASIAGFRLGRKILEQSAISRFLKREHLPGPKVETDDDIARLAGTFSKTDYHPVGTCRMGGDRDSVVSQASLKVRGLEGLRVCDSSVMPEVISSNTNAATIMIAEKGADLIKSDTAG
ncbi:GMC family oxidoreductase [Roseibium sp. M-1]